MGTAETEEKKRKARLNIYMTKRVNLCLAVWSLRFDAQRRTFVGVNERLWNKM